MKIAIYSRKSKYIVGSDSIENQIQMCKDYASSKYTNDKLEFDIYEDEGFSGGNINRPKFKELMKNIKKYDVLICYRLDRISRNVADFSSTLDLLQANNCDFVSIREQFDTSSPMGRAMIYIASVFAQLERETIAERVRDNMTEMARRGSWTGGRTPLGYSSETTTYIDDEGNERKLVKLVKNEEELKLVKLIYETYLREGSLHKTEIWFTQHNIKSNSGILLEKTTLKIILQNPVYVKSTPEVLEYMKNDGWNVYGVADRVHSLLSYNKTESVTIKGKSTKRPKDKSEWIAAMSSCEGVIDAEIWIDVQKQFTKNRDTFPRLGKTNNAILTGKLKCALCGSNMRVSHGTASKKTGEQFYYYICSMKKKSKGEICNANNLKAREIEESILIEIEKVAKNKKQFLKNIEKENKEKLKSKNPDVKKLDLEKQIHDKQKQMNNLVNKLSMDDSIADVLMSKIKELKDDIRILDSELLEITNTIQSAKEEEINISFISNILDKCLNIRNLSNKEQTELINIIIDVIMYNSETDLIDITFIGANAKKNKI
ncbi:MAG: recombinase family protein [Clostridium sp.]|uniref:recombinase family protein n=1 Tax=Clostridium sp. TaxID=1506 RepID=UPI0025C6F051|nr:recombinase family protein [Clostridium sp.]MCE5220888.1 recombinase family protein [Clostridium sp.]